MKADITSIVNELKKVKVEQIIYEAITNSIQANASEILVECNDLNANTIDNGDEHLIQEILIADNGHGFTNNDIESFQTYRSTYKKTEFGSKGVGRFLYLKLFKEVNIDSLNNNIHFTEKNDVEIKQSDLFFQETTIKISNAKDAYQINKTDLAENIRQHFLPYFKLLKDQRKRIQIKLSFNKIHFKTLVSDEIPNFQSKGFEICGHDFRISYLFNHPEFTKLEGVYCADNRVVTRNSELVKKKVNFKGFYGLDLFYILSSDYLNKNLNDERDEFTINPKRTSQHNLYDEISWENINDALAVQLKTIAIENGINILESSEQELNNAINSNPFLTNYLINNEYAYPEKELIKRAKQQFEDDKEFLRNFKSIKNQDYTAKLNKVVQSELSEYIFDRQKTIDELKKLVDEKQKEEAVHNLFMKKYTEDSNLDYKTNNLWLFDDRFMSYDKVFSEQQIQHIFPELSENLERPDILSIYSNTYEKDDITDIVIVEFKKPDEKITPARAKEQLQSYARYINSTKKPTQRIRVWGYAFLKFDNKTVFYLENDDFNQIITHHKYPICYRYYEKSNVIVNILDYSSLAYDAESRNQTFLNILKGRHYKK